MQKLIEGLHHFQQNVFGSQQDLFERLSRGQSPETLFITCSDSRINPNLLTQTQPGELFILRNAGNLIPPYTINSGGEAATIEFAVDALSVKDIIICGHSHCGAMDGLMHPENIRSFPALSRWLSYADATRRIVQDLYAELSDEERLNVAILENVLAQMENLRTHPSVAAGLAKGSIRIHGWVYKFETGETFGYDPEAAQFMPVETKKTRQPRGRKPLKIVSI
jgi:carbonic anhydrase